MRTVLVLGGDEEVGRRVGIRLAGLEHDLGAGHDGGVASVLEVVKEMKICTANWK